MTGSAAMGEGTAPDAGASREREVVLALGSNLGDREEHIRRGLEYLAERITVTALSRLVESEPWGPVPQPAFLNLVLLARTELGPLGLLEALRGAELDAGRIRVVKQGPRTLDVDLIFYASEQIRLPDLEVPHPRWQERPFVRDLLGDLPTTIVDPVSGRPLRELAPGGGLPPELREVAPAEEMPRGTASSLRRGRTAGRTER
jgi:2-amino-4-hydroxy-6-hydroxymethyldihydropteridine diphosphokinase